MNLVELVRRYQGYDPITGAFGLTRTNDAYAAQLGIHPSNLTRLYRGTVDSSPTVIRALLRTFPQAANEIGQAMLAEVA